MTLRNYELAKHLITVYMVQDYSLDTPDMVRLWSHMHTVGVSTTHLLTCITSSVERNEAGTYPGETFAQDTTYLLPRVPEY